MKSNVREGEGTKGELLFGGCQESLAIAGLLVGEVLIARLSGHRIDEVVVGRVLPRVPNLLVLEGQQRSQADTHFEVVHLNLN